MPRPIMAMEFQSDPSAVHYHVNPPPPVHASRCRSVNHIIVAGHSVMQSHHVGISRFADAQVLSSYCSESSQRFRAVAWTLAEPPGSFSFQAAKPSLFGYEHDGTSAKPARRPGFGAGPPGIAGTASSSAGHPDAEPSAPCSPGFQARSLYAIPSMGPPARCRHGAGHGFHPAQDAIGGQPPYRIPSAGRGRLRVPWPAWSRAGLPEGSAIAVDGSPASDSRPRVARGAHLVAGYAHESPGGRAKGGWGRYQGELTTARQLTAELLPVAA